MLSTQEISAKSPTEIGNVASLAVAPSTSNAQTVGLGEHRIIRRNGAVVGFEPSKISIAVTKAFLAVNGGQGAASARVRAGFRRSGQRQWGARAVPAGVVAYLGRR